MQDVVKQAVCEYVENHSRLDLLGSGRGASALRGSA